MEEHSSPPTFGLAELVLIVIAAVVITALFFIRFPAQRNLPAVSPTATPEVLNIYTNHTYGYSLELPSSWQKFPSEQKIEEFGEDINGKALFSIGVDDSTEIRPGETLDEFAARAAGSISQLQNVTKLTVGGEDAYTGTLAEGGPQVTYLLHRGKVYVFVSYPEDSIFFQTIATFKFLD